MMRGFLFTVDMLYGTIIVILLFAILINIPSNTLIPQQQLLQIQAKDAVMAWFYSSPTPNPGLLDSCPSAGDRACACDTAFRPRVTTTPLSPATASDWIEQTVCVVSP